ncbi:MAG: M20/M25/M40 family metallo-hydrolase, partial [Cyclobacteriaceae bacterium]
MKRALLFLLISSVLAPGQAQKKPKINANKKAVIASIDSKYAQLTELSDKIWSFEEIAFQEKQSAQALSDFAEANGFNVTRGVAEIPTAFTAEYGSGKPVIGILGEFDALPGLSQKTVPNKDPLNPGSAGHGCGHNLFGVASLGAAIAVKELIEAGKLQGTVRFYGTPAEEK